MIAESFSRDKCKLTVFGEIVEAVYDLIDPDKYDLFYKYDRTRITGKNRAKSTLYRRSADRFI